MARASVGRPPRRLLNNNNNSVKTIPDEVKVDSEVSDDRLNRELDSGFCPEARTGNFVSNEGSSKPVSVSYLNLVQCQCY